MNGRQMLMFILFLQFSAAVFAGCANYTDSFSVLVLDGNLRPIQGAAVTVTFDRGASFGSQYFTTQPNYTGTDGTLRYTILNQGTSTRPIDCTITINATASGENARRVEPATRAAGGSASSFSPYNCAAGTSR